jgi:hypothetical protein
VYTPPLNIQISKLAKTMVINAKFGSTCKSKFFIVIGSTSSNSIIWEGNET